MLGATLSAYGCGTDERQYNVPVSNPAGTTSMEGDSPGVSGVDATDDSASVGAVSETGPTPSGGSTGTAGIDGSQASVDNGDTGTTTAWGTGTAATDSTGGGGTDREPETATWWTSSSVVTDGPPDDTGDTDNWANTSETTTSPEPASSTEPVTTTDPTTTSETPSSSTSSSSSSSTGTSSTSTTTDTTTVPPIPAVDKYFVQWPANKEPLEVGKHAAAIFTSKSLNLTPAAGAEHSNTDDYKHYKDACAWYGALSVALIAGEQLLIDSLVAKYDPYKNTWGAFNPPTTANQFIGTVDDSLFGIVPLEIAKYRSDASYVQEGDIAADHQLAFIEQQKRHTSDDMFMITALQVQAYRVITDANHRKKHLDLAAATMVEYLQLMQRSDGLIPHHLDREDYAIAWGRGNGWFAAGMAELIRELPSNHPNYAAISAGYAKMMNGLVQYQIPQGQIGAGLWKQVVDSSDSRNWVETSGSAMFTYAIVSGVRAGWLDVETFGPAARNAWLGLVGQLNSNGEVQNISDWVYLPSSHGYSEADYVGDEERYYFERPKLTGDGHGQAPLMWSAAALSRPLE